MSGYTPGPWIADLYEDGCFVVRPHGEEGPIIAERGVWFDDESQANARLIAAAPDMREALGVGVTVMKDAQDDIRSLLGENSIIWQRMDNVIRVMREAIAKADTKPEGETR